MSEAERAAFDRGYWAALEADEGKSLIVQFDAAMRGQKHQKRVAEGWAAARAQAAR